MEIYPYYVIQKTASSMHLSTLNPSTPDGNITGTLE